LFLKLFAVSTLLQRCVSGVLAAVGEAFPHWTLYCNVALTSLAAMIYDGLEFPSSADLLMRRNWPIYQKLSRRVRDK